LAVTGDNAVGVYSPQTTVLAAEAFLPVDRVVAPVGLSNLPGYPALFVGRDRALAGLDAVLGEAGSVVVQAVHGLGGVGKSTLAARWAADHRPQFTPLWWITADSTAALDAGLAGLAVALDPVAGTVLSGEALRDRAVAWLGCHAGWLVVLDNVTAPADVAWVVARCRTGRFLITSRRADGWHQVTTSSPIRLDVLDQDDAVALLVGVLTHDPTRSVVTDGAEVVCREVGRLPLAIEQVGAYCVQTGTSPAGYLELLARYPAQLVATVADGADPDRSVARVWRVTLDHLAHIDPLTGVVLRILAWWAPSGVSRQLLTGIASPLELNLALGRLAAYSMITLDGDRIVVHPLVQAVSRIPDEQDPHRQSADIERARTQAVRSLADQLPDDPLDVAGWPVWRNVLPHVDALRRQTHADLDTVPAARLYNQAGVFSDNQGDLTAAVAYLRRAVSAYERVLGPHHPSTLGSYNNLAGAYRAAGDLARAIPLLEQTFTDTHRVLGADHPDTFSLCNNLAYLYEAAGDLTRAIPLYEQTLADCNRVLGSDRPQTLASRSNLAGAYQAAGDLARAIPLLEQTFTDTHRVLGADHPDTLTSRNNLASGYEAAGDLTRAIPLYEQTLADRNRVLGPDHPQTLASHNNLASAYRAVGDLGRAIQLHEQNLANTHRVLGSDHPDTLASCNNLAYVYERAGDLALAIPLYEQVLADRIRVLGPDHPHTLLSRNNLAYAYRVAGDLARAIPLYEQTLADRNRVLGPDHPETFTSRNNLAYAYRVAGDLARAISLYEQTLTDAHHILGPDHPLSRTIHRNLTMACGESD
jgi:tetratricopeptide (TPR) repeat protein